MIFPFSQNARETLFNEFNRAFPDYKYHSLNAFDTALKRICRQAIECRNKHYTLFVDKHNRTRGWNRSIKARYEELVPLMEDYLNANIYCTGVVIYSF